MLAAKLSSEWELLLACASAHIEQADFQRRVRTLIDAGVDWDYVVEVARQQGLAPLLYFRLQQTGLLEVPSRAAIEALKTSYYSNAVRSTLLYAELGKVLQALAGIRCEVIVLKGATLAETVYPLKAVRPMNDVDLLIRKEDLPRIEARLNKLYYYLDDSHRTKDWYHQHHYHLTFRQAEGAPTAVHFEMHWNIEYPSRPFGIDVDGLWQRARPSTTANVTTLVLSPEDLLLHLCLHTYHHRLMLGLRSLCDISRVLRYYGSILNWDQLQAWADEWGIKPYVYLTFCLAKDLLRATLRESSLEGLKPDDFDPRLRDWATAKIIAGNDVSAISPNVAQFWKTTTFKEKLTCLRTTLSSGVLAKNYPISASAYKRYWYYPAPGTPSQAIWPHNLLPAPPRP